MEPNTSQDFTSTTTMGHPWGNADVVANFDLKSYRLAAGLEITMTNVTHPNLTIPTMTLGSLTVNTVDPDSDTVSGSGALPNDDVQVYDQ